MTTRTLRGYVTQDGNIFLKPGDDGRPPWLQELLATDYAGAEVLVTLSVEARAWPAWLNSAARRLEHGPLRRSRVVGDVPLPLAPRTRRLLAPAREARDE